MMEYYFCERTSDALWAEPLNVSTSFLFLLASIIMFVQVQRHNVPTLMLPLTIMAVLSMTSAWHHLQYTDAVYQFDTGLLLLFLVSTMYSGHRLVWQHSPGVSFLWAIGFVPMAVAMIPIFTLLPSSDRFAFYAPIPVILMGHSLLLRDRYPETSDGVFMGASLLVLSLAPLALDLPVCDQFPMGTHFIWQILAAIAAGWIIHVFIEHQKRERKERIRRELAQSLDGFAMY